MATKKLSEALAELPLKEQAAGTEHIIVNDEGTSKRMTMQTAFGVYNMGDMASSDAAENAALQPAVSGNNKINIIRYFVPSLQKEGFFVQQVGDWRTVQFHFWDGGVQARHIWFKDNSRTTLNVGYGWDWKRVMATSLKYEASSRTLKLNDASDTTFGDVTLPEATTSAPGLLPATAARTLSTGTMTESGSTTTAVRVTYPNYWAGGTRALTLSACTTAKAGVMTPEMLAKLNSAGADANGVTLVKFMGDDMEGELCLRCPVGFLKSTDEVVLFRKIKARSRRKTVDGEDAGNTLWRGWRRYKTGGLEFRYDGLTLGAMLGAEYNTSECELYPVTPKGFTDWADFIVQGFVSIENESTLRIKNGQRAFFLDTSAARQAHLNWGLQVLRDGKPITGILPFHAVVTTARGVEGNDLTGMNVTDAAYVAVTTL